MDEDGFLGMGWLRDIPDLRDYTPEEPMVANLLSQSKALKTTVGSPPATVDLRQWCSPIEDQDGIGSCTAQAGVGLFEYFERRAFGRYLNASRLFLYKVTRNLLKWTGDTGAYIRTTMKAMVLFGIPPEYYWPHIVADFDKEPPAFCYAFGQNYQSIRYFRHDPPGRAADQVLASVKAYLAAGLASMFGFSVYSSIPRIGQGTGDIPFPKSGDKLLGGHAVCAVGYDDNRKIGAHTGALLIRNSWGTAWGEAGYGWLPYEYVMKGLAVDWWSLIRAEFVDTDLFK